MRWLAGGVAACVFMVLVTLVGIIGSVVGTPTAVGFQPSDSARADIPPEYLALCTSVGEKYHLDWAILCAITKVETDHGRLRASGVTSGTNSAGAKGPCQFLQGTWDMPGIGNGGDPYNPADCLPAMARYLINGGAPGDWEKAVFSYNHASWYVQKVMAQAAVYRGVIGQVPRLISGSIRARIVRIAEQTLTSRTGYLRYSQPGALTDDPTPDPPARTDCSQWVRAIYLLAGAPDPGTTTWDQIAHGHQTSSPRPGDLLFTPNEDHVEIYVGGGKTIGHGSPPIDYASVSDFPSHFFMAYAGVE